MMVGLNLSRMFQSIHAVLPPSVCPVSILGTKVKYSYFPLLIILI